MTNGRDYLLMSGDAGRIPLADGSVHCVVTSPPYFGLRSYLDDADPRKDKEIGLEPTPAEFVAALVAVFREVRRVLRDDGTAWLNLADSYSQSEVRHRNGHSSGLRNGNISPDEPWMKGVHQTGRKLNHGLKPKDLIGIPWRVAFALQADGWYLRSDIIWAKPNPMPESVMDRPTKSHEYIFLLAKGERYYFDAEAVKEPVTESTVERLLQPTLGQQRGSYRVPGKTNGAMKAVGSVDRRNIRSVWTVPVNHFNGAHFATFPPALIRPCILAGSPKGGIVFDPFIGTGTTIEVAVALGRRAIGLDLDARSIVMATRRLERPHAAPIRPARTEALPLFDANSLADTLMG